LGTSGIYSRGWLPVLGSFPATSPGLHAKLGSLTPLGQVVAVFHLRMDFLGKRWPDSEPVGLECCPKFLEMRPGIIQACTVRSSFVSRIIKLHAVILPARNRTNHKRTRRLSHSEIATARTWKTAFHIWFTLPRSDASRWSVVTPACGSGHSFAPASPFQARSFRIEDTPGKQHGVGFSVPYEE